MILIGNQNDEATTVRLVKCIGTKIEGRESRTAFSSPHFLMSLPYINELINFSGYCLGDIREIGVKREIENVDSLLLLLYHSTAGESFYCAGSSIEDFEGAGVICIDLRVIYEVYCLCLSTPIGQLKPNRDESFSIFSSILAVRLNRNGTGTERIIASLLSNSAAYLLDCSDPRIRFFRDLKAIELDSYLNEPERLVLLRGILAFVIYHESAHYLISESDEFDRSLLDQIKRFSVLMQEHHDEDHESTWTNGLRNFFSGLSESIKVKDIDRVKVINSKSKSTSNFITRAEVEEWLCDLFGVARTLGFITHLTQNRNTLISVNHSLEMMIRIFGFIKYGLKFFGVLSEYYDLLAERKINPDSVTDEQINSKLEELASYSELGGKAAESNNFRMRFFQHTTFTVLVGYCKDWFSKNETREPMLSAIHPSPIEAVVWNDFLLDFHSRIMTEIMSFQGATILSSRGRILMSLRESEGVSSLPNNIDPFSLLYLGRTDFL